MVLSCIGLLSLVEFPPWAVSSLRGGIVKNSFLSPRPKQGLTHAFTQRMSIESVDFISILMGLTMYADK